MSFVTKVKQKKFLKFYIKLNDESQSKFKLIN